jgi:hypothetical protein
MSWWSFNSFCIPLENILPVDCPVPLSSKLIVAIPIAFNLWEINRNGRCFPIDEYLSCGPDPEMNTARGNEPVESGQDSVPTSFTESSELYTSTVRWKCELSSVMDWPEINGQEKNRTTSELKKEIRWGKVSWLRIIKVSHLPSPFFHLKGDSRSSWCFLLLSLLLQF